MKKNATFALVAAITSFVLAGCGGGGGGGGGQQPVKRSSGIVGSYAADLQANHSYEISAAWTAPNTADVAVRFDSAEANSAGAVISISADKTVVTIEPNSPAARYDITLKFRHESGLTPPDPDAGKLETAVVDTSNFPGYTAMTPTGELTVDEGDTIQLGLMAETTRASGFKIGIAPRTAAGRSTYRPASARWSVAASSLGTFNPVVTDNAYTAFKAASELSGDGVISAQALDGRGANTGAPVTAVLHTYRLPQISSTLTEGQAITSPTTVTVTSQFTIRLEWQVDSAPNTAISGGSFVIDPAMFTDGAHVVKLYGIGSRKTVVKQYNITTTKETPKTLTVDSPAEGAVAPNKSLTVSWTATAGATVEVNVEGAWHSATGSSYSYVASDVTQKVTVKATWGSTVKTADRNFTVAWGGLAPVGSQIDAGRAVNAAFKAASGQINATYAGGAVVDAGGTNTNVSLPIDGVPTGFANGTMACPDRGTGKLLCINQDGSVDSSKTKSGLGYVWQADSGRSAILYVGSESGVSAFDASTSNWANVAHFNGAFRCIAYDGPGTGVRQLYVSDVSDPNGIVRFRILNAATGGQVRDVGPIGNIQSIRAFPEGDAVLVCMTSGNARIYTRSGDLVTTLPYALTSIGWDYSAATPTLVGCNGSRNIQLYRPTPR